jgi:hypothetical protein
LHHQPQLQVRLSHTKTGDAHGFYSRFTSPCISISIFKYVVTSPKGNEQDSPPTNQQVCGVHLEILRDDYDLGEHVIESWKAYLNFVFELSARPDHGCLEELSPLNPDV